jgi:hypothetical protein
MSFSADVIVAKGDSYFGTSIENLEGANGNDEALKVLDESVQILRQWLVRGVLSNGLDHEWKMTLSQDDDGVITIKIASD